MASSRIHPTLAEHQGPPSGEVTQSSTTPAPETPAAPNTLPYPAPVQPSFPVPHVPVPAPAPANNQVTFLPPPPSYNSVAPYPQPYGQTYGVVPAVGQYPVGYQPYGMQQQQQQQQTVILTGRPAPTYIRTYRSNNVDEATGAIILSCFVFWCCGVLFGMVAFILGVVACNKTGNQKDAHCLSVASYIVSGVGIGVAILVIIIVASVVGSNTSNTSSTSSSSSSSSSTSCSSGYYEVAYSCYRYRLSNSDASACKLLGGYYSWTDSYCYYTNYYSAIYSCGSSYYRSATSRCYAYRVSLSSSSTCSSSPYRGYYDSTYRYCYYS